MKGRIVSFAVQPRSRRGLVTFELDGDFGEIYDELKDVDIDLIVKKWKKRMPTPIIGCCAANFLTKSVFLRLKCIGSISEISAEIIVFLA